MLAAWHPRQVGLTSRREGPNLNGILGTPDLSGPANPGRVASRPVGVC